MSGRASRARLLAPSFLVVASAIACGGASRGGLDGVAGGPGSGGTFTMNPPPVSECPPLPPTNGSPCVGPTFCNFSTGTTAGNGCPPPMTSASCQDNAWRVSQSITSCNPPIPFMCPATLPPAGSPCYVFGAPPPPCTFAAALCPFESARCESGVWQLDRCEQLGGAAGQGAGGDVGVTLGGAPGAAGAPAEGGAAQGGSP